MEANSNISVGIDYKQVATIGKSCEALALSLVKIVSKNYTKSFFTYYFAYYFGI